MVKLEPIILRPLDDGFELREVQKIAIDMLRKSYQKGNKRTIIHLATSGGKTILAGMIFRMIFEKNPTAQCWFIAPRITLLSQTKSEFENVFGYDCGIVQGDSEIDLTKHVQIATIQTLANRLTSSNGFVYDRFNQLPVAMVACDEAHLMFDGYKTVMDAWMPYMSGLSATPFTRGLGLLWQDMVRPKRMAELIEDGTISDYRVKACVSINRKNLTKSSTGEYKAQDVEDETGAIIGDVYQEWKDSDDMKNRPFLGFTQTIASCVALSELFNENGAKTAYVHSKMSDQLVQDTLDAFKAGFYDGIFSVVKLIEGFDFPAASAMIDCAPLAPSKDDKNIPNSPQRYVQKLGRVIRKHSSKDYALVHDHANNFLQYGNIEFIEDLFPTLDRSEKKEEKKLTVDERLERVVLECSNCGMIFKGKQCNICGHRPKKPTQFIDAGNLEFVDGEMFEIKKTDKLKKEKNPAMSKIDFARQLKTYVLKIKEKNPKANIKGVYAHKFRDYFGVWPVKSNNIEQVVPAIQTKEFSSWIKSKNIAYAKSQAKLKIEASKNG